jgi:hypothetical protein
MKIEPIYTFETLGGKVKIEAESIDALFEVLNKKYKSLKMCHPEFLEGNGTSIIFLKNSNNVDDCIGSIKVMFKDVKCE